MKKTFCYICLFIMAIAASAQNIPVESFVEYREQADLLFEKLQYDESIDLYMQLAFSGDVYSCNKLYNIYSQGIGVERDMSIAEKWKMLAKECKREQMTIPIVQRKSMDTKPILSESTLEETLNLSGDFIERGAKLKNSAIGVSVLGAAIAVSFSMAGYYSETNGLIIAGCAIGGGLGLVATIMNIVGNNYIRNGGRILHNVQFTGSEIKVKF